MEARAATETSHPEGIDLCSSFLDDGFCAFSAPAVRCFLLTLTDGFRRIGLTVNLDNPRAPPLGRSARVISTGALGTGPPTASSWEHLSDPTSGVNSLWVVALPRPEHSCPPLASSRMPKALFAYCVCALGGPRSCTLVVRCPRTPSRMASGLRTVIFARP